MSDEKVLELYNNNRRLIPFVINKLKYYSPGYDMDDFIQIGNMALWVASKTYNPENGTKFSTYAVHCIKNELRKALRHKKYTECHTYEESDDIRIYHGFEEQIENKVLVDSFLDSLDEKSRYMVTAVYIHQRPKVSVARELHIPRETFNYHLRKILNRAREMMV